MTKEESLLAHESIMEAACDQCHWPFVYSDEDTMYAEKCEFCRVDAAVEAVLKKVTV